LVVLAFGLRLGGLLHPHVIFSDLGLHANNLLGVSVGQVFFTEGLPAEAGGGQSPYPPGTYLLLAPLQLLLPVGDEGRRLLLKGGLALLDSLVLGLIWLLLRPHGRRAALLGAALYLAPPPLLSSFSIGEFANIGGQALALPVLALLAATGVQSAKSKMQNAKIFAFCISLFALLIALLGHLGVVISLVCTLAALWLVWGLAALRRGGVWRSRLALLSGAGLLAAVLAFVCYYSAPIFMAIFAERIGGGAAPSSTSISALRIFAPLLQIFMPGGNITPLLSVTGLLGMTLLLTHNAQRATRNALQSLLLAWWLGTLLSLALLLFARQGVRWQHFLYPALCLGAGPALAAFWPRGGAGRAAALAGALFPICYGVAYWVGQLRDYLH
jgi:hypothetical protein